MPIIYYLKPVSEATLSMHSLIHTNGEQNSGASKLQKLLSHCHGNAQQWRTLVVAKANCWSVGRLSCTNCRNYQPPAALSCQTDDDSKVSLID